MGFFVLCVLCTLPRLRICDSAIVFVLLITRNGKTPTKGSASIAAGSTARNLSQPLLRSCFRKKFSTGLGERIKGLSQNGLTVTATLPGGSGVEEDGVLRHKSASQGVFQDPAVVDLSVGLVQFLNDVDALEIVRIAQERGLVELFVVHGDGAAEGFPEIGYVDVGGDPPNEQDEGAVAEDAAPNAEAGVGVVNEAVPDEAQAVDIDEACQHDVEEVAAMDEAAQNDEEVAAVAVDDVGQNNEADEIVVDEIGRTDVAEAEVVDEAAQNEGEGDKVEEEAGQGVVSAGDENVEDGVGGLSDLENQNANDQSGVDSDNENTSDDEDTTRKSPI
ncbi:hypothetical protein PIB30_077009 [Stylosanthes scabra]|uniref:Uncharacterized protein n=1 Tax=Stylosanthes scabra TaxID=79078 RepID=A0ABU6QSR3_9FABA|nr:hypothetical protein [Stylosanthes scabra]